MLVNKSRGIITSEQQFEKRGKMRFLHTADWHIGKKLHDYSLVEEQLEAFSQIKKIAQTEQVDAVVIAGDLYDRSLPSETAVTLVDQMLYELNLKANLPLLVISGNHDSAVRLATGSDWYKQTDFYVHTKLSQAFEPIELKDVQFFLLPYFELQAARNYFDEEIKNITEALQRIVALMQERFDPEKKHVLVAHFFVAGSLRTASETSLEIGGLDAVPAEVFQVFDHVALGHLHDKDASQAEHIKYSGSLLKYSIAEATREKGVWIVDTERKTTKWCALKPLHDIKLLKGTFAELTAPKSFQSITAETFTALELTDEHPVIDAMSRLRQYYPRLLELKWQKQPNSRSKQRQKAKQQTPLELLAGFFEQTTGQEMTRLQADLAKECLEKLRQKEDV